MSCQPETLFWLGAALYVAAMIVAGLAHYGYL
jgi:hypothetical protein